MSVEVVICTLNRCRMLDRTLRSLRNLTMPDDVRWSVLVVDNGSTDGTARVVARQKGKLPIRRVVEPTTGLSHARNRGAEEARGDYIVWTDDDVLPDADWLRAYAAAFREWEHADFFGGPIEPVFEGRTPKWLKASYDDVAEVYSARDLGPRPLPITTRGRLPFGANMAIRSDVQRNHDYHPRLGRSGRSLVGGEEVEMLGRILDDGRTGRWVPGARLRHVIPQGRQTVAYLRRWFRDLGRLASLQTKAPHLRVYSHPESIEWACRAAPTEELKYLWRRLVGPPGSWLQHLTTASYAEGIILESLVPGR